MTTWKIELVTNEIVANTIDLEAASVLKIDYQTLTIDGEKWELPNIAGLSFARVEREDAPRAAPGKPADRCKWDDAELRQFLIACADSSMSRNNREQMAGEILEMLYGPNKAANAERLTNKSRPKWFIVLDRYGDESRAKGGVFSIYETAQKIVNEFAHYEYCGNTPFVEVCPCGTGQALADLLRDMGVPVITTYTRRKRIGIADVYETPITDDRNNG